MKKITTKEFKEKLHKKYGNDYSLIGEYTNSYTKVTIKHNKCGHIYLVYPASILNGHECFNCYKKNKLNRDKRLPIEDVINHIKNEKNNEFTLLNHYYKNGHLMVKVKHSICQTISEMSYVNFRKGIGCKHCAKIKMGKSRIMSNEEFLKRVKKLHGNEYTFLEEYKGCHTKVKVRHNVCKYEYFVTPEKFLGNRKCPKCANKIRAESKAMTEKEFKQRVEELTKGEYSVISNYKRSYVKVRIKHNKCGHEWDVTPVSFLSGTRCPNCKQLNSKGCAEIERLLKLKGINYAREVKLENCKNIFQLPFDFAITENSKIKMLIEYDGEQHFKPIKYYGGYKKFKERIKRDNIKNEYCKRNHLKLLRIKYTDFDKIQEILSKEL